MTLKLYIIYSKLGNTCGLSNLVIAENKEQAINILIKDGIEKKDINIASIDEYEINKPSYLTNFFDE